MNKKKVHRYTVGKEDFPNFFGEDIHEVCSTYVLCREAEKLGRLFILAFLDKENEGIGTFVELKHIGPAFYKEEIIFKGEIIDGEMDNFVVAFEAKVGQRLIAKGRTGQKLVKKKKLLDHFKKIKNQKLN